MKTESPPKDLKKIGKQFWRRCLREYEMDSGHDLERLAMACKCLDDLAEAEERVKKDGMFVTNRYGNTAEHPAIKTIKDMRLLFVKIIRELGLDLTTGPESRTPGRY